MAINVSTPDRRMYPVVFLVDSSGSMADDGKIDVLNAALRGAVDLLASVRDPDFAIWLAVIAFDTNSELYVPLTPAQHASVRPIVASGRTAFGAALEQLASLLDDSTIPETAIPPTVVLVSDGQPTDNFGAPLERLESIERFRSSLRLAIWVGADRNSEHLKRFTGSAEQVFSVSELVTLPGLMLRSARAVEAVLTERNSSRRPKPTGSEDD